MYDGKILTKKETQLTKPSTHLDTSPKSESGLELQSRAAHITKMNTHMSGTGVQSITWKAAHRGPLRICKKCKCVMCLMTEIQTIEGDWKDVSALEGTTLKNGIYKEGRYEGLRYSLFFIKQEITHQRI